MPTSIAHAIGGYAAMDAGLGNRSRVLILLALALVAANAPDLDFVLGALSGNPGRYHRMASHSLAFALGAAALSAPLLARWTGGWRTAFALVLLAYGSHIVLDLVIPDPNGGSGPQLFWPLTSGSYEFPLPGLERWNDARRIQQDAFTRSLAEVLLNWTAVRVFLVDAVLALPLLALGVGARRLRERWALPPRAAQRLQTVTLKSSR